MILNIVTFFFRVLTDIKSGSIAQEFLNSKPNTIWRQIYDKQMNDESFMPISEGTQNILQKNQLLTQYSEIESMMYNTKPCLLKTLWKSSSKDRHSMAFQKGSPLVPFFKYAYGKLRQTGTLARIKQKWEKKGISGNCGSNQLRPISFNKIASAIVLLLLGMCIAFLISVIELFYKRRAEAKIIDKVAIPQKLQD